MLKERIALQADGGGFAFDDRHESSASDPTQKRVAPEITAVSTKPGARPEHLIVEDVSRSILAD